MRAWAIRTYGEPMQELELPVPRPRARDLLIHMQGAEVGDWDELVRTGEWPMERPFPLVLGLAGAGTVAAAGNDTRPFAEGDRVFAYSYPLYDNGAWAEYMLVPHTYAAWSPQALSPVHAGAVPIAGLTAHETLNKVLQVRTGETVLITAAAGGVGHLAVQIAAGLGAHVVATASRRNHEFLRGLGAQTLIDYAHEDVVAAVRAKWPAGVDKVLNGVTGEAARQAVRALRKGGRMVDLPGELSDIPPGVEVITDYVVRADGDRLGRVATMIDYGELKVHIDAVYSFESAPKALARVLEKHVRGTLALALP
jgi:NADPH:quinone reductase-like Zn-dependent oxidoreductase